MKNVLVTGSKGFIGKNLIVALKRISDLSIFEYDIDSDEEKLEEFIKYADVIYHLAAIYRPEKIEDYSGNVLFTKKIVDLIIKNNRKPLIVFSSSIQAVHDNPYGKSKREAEKLMENWATSIGAVTVIYRLPNVFGKWCRPNYNSAVATFCYNIARCLDIQIIDPGRVLKLIYVDDIVKEFISLINRNLSEGYHYLDVEPVFTIKITDLVNLIREFNATRDSLSIPDFRNPFFKRLYATFISYLPEDKFSYEVPVKSDKRGELAELMKSFAFGQIFISRTRPGEIRGNHYHDSKVEKFIVIDGEAIISFRHIIRNEIIEYQLSGKDFKIVDIPPGYTHSIKNIGQQDLIVLFWADEIFDPERADTYYLEVRNEKY